MNTVRGCACSVTRVAGSTGCDHQTQADLLVISCTDYRSLEAVPALEQAPGKPVITGNLALIYTCLRRLEIEMKGIEAGGYLFTHRN